MRMMQTNSTFYHAPMVMMANHPWAQKTLLAAFFALTLTDQASANHAAMVTFGSPMIDFATWKYGYNVSNAQGSIDSIDAVILSKTLNAPVKDASHPRKWEFEDNVPNNSSFRWSTDVNFLGGLFKNPIGPGETKEFRALSIRPPMTGVLTAEDTANFQTKYSVNVPDTQGGAQFVFHNQPGGTGTFDASSGLWDYKFTLEALENGIRNGDLIFDQNVDITNVVIDKPDWKFLHVGYALDDPALPGDRSDPLLTGLGIFYTTGPALSMGETVNITLSSHFGPGSVGVPNGNVVSGPTSVVPEPSALMMMTLGILTLLGIYKRRV